MTRWRPALSLFVLLLICPPPLHADQGATGIWASLEHLVSATFSFGVTGLVTFAVWRFVNRLLSELVGDRLATIAAIFCCLLVISAGLRVANQFILTSEVPLLHAVSSGIVETYAAIVGPTRLSPLEYMTVLGLALFATYWLLTRFPAKASWEEVRAKLEGLVNRVNFFEK